MATASHVRPRRAAARSPPPCRKIVIGHQCAARRHTRTARTALVLIGTAGLAALAVAVVGPSAWTRCAQAPCAAPSSPRQKSSGRDSRPLREQIAGLFQHATPIGRERLVRNFQSWIGHFHAT